MLFGSNKPSLISSDTRSAPDFGRKIEAPRVISKAFSLEPPLTLFCAPSSRLQFEFQFPSRGNTIFPPEQHKTFCG